jgi:hypothetical protein
MNRRAFAERWDSFTPMTTKEDGPTLWRPVLACIPILLSSATGVAANMPQ